MMHMGSMFMGGGMFIFGIGVVIFLLALFWGAKLLRKWKGRSAMTDRRDSTPEKLPSSVQRQIFELAKQNKGRLTVTDVVLGTGLSLRQAEEALNSMVDGYRIRMNVHDSGMIIYEFAELIQQWNKKLLAAQ
jgi:hypothetical protein